MKCGWAGTAFLALLAFSASACSPAEPEKAQTLLQQAFTPGEGVRVLESDRLHCYRD